MKSYLKEAVLKVFRIAFLSIGIFFYLFSILNSIIRVFHSEVLNPRYFLFLFYGKLILLN
jgi:hypothetical protein